MKPLSGHWNVPSDKPTSSTPASLLDHGTPGHGHAYRAGDPRISVIIPTLNEASTIEECLGQFDGGSARPDEPAGLPGPSGPTEPHGPDESTGPTGPTGPPGTAAPTGPTSLEIIVVDGGSDDGTPEIVRSRPGARLIESGIRGRAIQMNAGAAASSGDVLLFLHADTRLPAGWRELVAESICGRGKAGGRFRFDIAHAKRIYRWITRGTNFRSRFLGITYGDQAIYTTREAFEAVGGYPGIPVFEDSRFADLLKKNGGLDWIDEAVLTSARRWERRGPVRTLLLTWLLWLAHTLFVPPGFLSRFYGVVR
ncbi:MAG: TIGR04283 family arsenosugar biosynthesis glycosyltransferase [Gemmatimonadetes bacterium]|nr:TIGR04283 family arsenosugar biosynthesis glycosyltransferase [Gemmatimonadota bacterium]